MIYQFNQFELNQELRELRHNNVPLDVQPKVFDLLVYLIQNKDRAVSKDDIQDALWSNLEVTETALTRSVMKVRKILAADTTNPPYIKTIHGHGYRFVADVTESSHQTENVIQKTSNKKKSWIGILTISTLISFIAVGFIFFNQNSFSHNSSIAFLPFIDKTNNSDFAWTSIGLMGLSTEILKAQSNISTVSNKKTAQFTNIKTESDMDLSTELLATIKDELQASHIVLSQLELTGEKSFTLKYAVYHPKGKQDTITLSGDNPTELSQEMTRNIIRALPDSGINQQKYRVVSENSFTNELYARGVALRIEGKANQARDYFKLAMDEDSGLLLPRYQYAITSRLIGLYDESITELTNLNNELSSLATNDKDLAIQIQNALGSAHMHKADYQQGILHYEKAFNLSEENLNFDYAIKIATNIAWIYKAKRDYHQSRIWVSKSLQMLKEHNFPPITNNIFLLAELETRRNNFDKAELLYNEAYENYLNENNKEYAAKTLRALSNIDDIRGLWNKALELNQRSTNLFIDLKREVDLLINNTAKVSLLINQGSYSEAIELNSNNIDQAKSQDLKQLFKKALYNKFLLLNIQKKYPMALEIYKTLPQKSYIQPSQLNRYEMIAAKIKYISGNKTPLLSWLKEYKSLTQTGDINNDLIYDHAKIFILEQDGSTKELELAYKAYIELSRSKGFIAYTTEYLLKLSHLYNNTNEFQQVKDIYNEIQLFGLDWWQILLLDARIKFVEGHIDEAKHLAEKAKEQSTESWDENHDNIFNLIIK